jgi:citrate lyase alpha subunit
MKKTSGKAAAKHTAAKAAAKATANGTAVTEVKEAVVEKKGVKPEITVQYRHYEADMDRIIEKVKEDVEVRGNRGVEIEKMQVYVKAEDFAAYYVINDGIVGKVNLF